MCDTCYSNILPKSRGSRGSFDYVSERSDKTNNKPSKSVAEYPGDLIFECLIIIQFYVSGIF